MDACDAGGRLDACDACDRLDACGVPGFVAVAFTFSFGDADFFEVAVGDAALAVFEASALEGTDAPAVAPAPGTGITSALFSVFD